MSTYILNRDNVKQHARNAMGTYVLLDPDPGDPSVFVRTYVGRAATSVQRRLLRHASKGEHAAFEVHHWDSLEEVFQMECLLFHHNRSTLVNVRHPDSPRGLSMKCPYCTRQAPHRISDAAVAAGVA